MSKDVQVYAVGIFCASVCAPADMPVEDMERRVNAINPAGTERGWRKSEDATFANGQPNACPCERESGRLHYLLDC